MFNRLNFHYLLAINIIIFYGLLCFVDGRGGVSELQPLVLRFFDSGYLENDFFVNSTEELNIRYYLVKYIAFFSRFFGINYGFHIAGIFSFVLTLIFVYLISFKLTKNFFTSIIILILAMIPRNAGLDLGDWYLVNNQISANQLVMPLILGGLYFVLINKNIVALFLFSVLSFFHSMLGLEMMALFVFYTIFYGKHNTIKILVTTIFLLITTKYFYDLYYLKDLFYLEPLKLKEILIEFRHPHHYLVFHDGFLSPLLFFLLLIIFWRILNLNSQISTKFIDMFLITMIPLAILSIISINFYPLRIAISAIPFRLLSVVGFLVIIVGFGIFISKVLRLNSYNTNLPNLGSFQCTLLTIIFFVLSVTTLYSYQNKRFLVFNKIFDGLIQEDQEYLELVSFSNKINKLTPEDSIIITKKSQIRHLSNRAILEGSQFPFVDKYMDEWYRRHKDLKLSIDDNGLMRLKEKYGAKAPLFAVIESNRNTIFNKLHCNNLICLIKL